MKRSFTLIEILIVLVIVAVLVALAIPISQSIVHNAYGAEAKTNLNALYEAVAIYYDEVGKAPPAQTDLSIPPELGVAVKNTAHLNYYYDNRNGGADLQIYAVYILVGFSQNQLPPGTNWGYSISMMTFNNPDQNMHKAFGPYWRGNYRLVHKGGGVFEWQYTW